MPSVAFSQNTAATHIAIAAKSGFAIRIFGYKLVSGGTQTVKFQSGSNDLTGAMPLAANGQLGEPIGGNSMDPLPYFVCNHGEAFNVVLSAAVAITGYIIYDYVS